MEVIKEILRIVTSKSDVAKVFPELGSLTEQKESDSIAGKYLYGLLNDTYATDDEAAKALYGTSKSDSRYRTLKSRTYERLIHSSLFLQVKQPEHSEYLSYYYKCTRNLICAQSLMRFASRTASYAVAEKTLIMAERYQFTDICLALCRLLCETAALWGQRRNFDCYTKKVNLYLKVLEAEYRSEYLLDLFALEANVTSRTWQYMVSFGEQSRKEIIELEAQFGSHNLKLNVFRIKISLGEYEDLPYDIIEACNDAIAYLEANPHLSQPARLGEFRLRKMIMLLFTQQTREAHNIAPVVIDSFRAAGNNWYLAIYMAAIIAMRVGDFQAVENYIELATGRRKFVLLDESRKESWTILSAYLTIAESLGLREERKVSRHFRLSTYLNSVPEESKKKKVINIVILISHVCFLIINKDFDAAERRIEYTRIYVSRYLKEKHFNRVRVFLRMLQTLPRQSFDPRAIRKANEKLYEQLKATAADHSNATLFEFIQFETLYEGILGYLEEYERSLDY